MSENAMVTVVNPFQQTDLTMGEQQFHESGNALAANAEARAIAEVKAQVIMARQFPRDPAVAMDAILRECKRNTLAESAVYSFPRGKETVTGPSIRLAEVIARNWGNATYGYEVLERSVDKHGIGYSIIMAYAWDLETNLRIARQFEVKHFRATKSGGYKMTDDRDIYELEANMASRRMRACILQMIPGDVTQAAVDACKYTQTNGLNERMKNTQERLKIIAGTVKYYEKLGATLTDLEELLHAKQDIWTADHMMRLKEISTAINDGVAVIGDYIPRLQTIGNTDVLSKEQVKELMELTAKTGRQGEVSDMLKKDGITKFADIPAVKFAEYKKRIESMMGESVKTDDQKKAEEPKQEQKPEKKADGQ